MPYVVTQLCQGCKDSACSDVCPVNCFYELKAPAGSKLPDQLYISPDECIDCGACEPECPWEAIHEEGDIPAKLKDSVALNKECDTQRGLFKTAVYTEKTPPTPEQVKANRAKHGV